MVKEVCSDHLSNASGFVEWLAPDVKITVKNKIFPCHSAILGLHSKLLADMFSSDPNPLNWSKGVTVAFNGARPEAVQIYLTESYSQSHHVEDISNYSGIIQDGNFVDAIFDVIKLAHKLDNAHFQKIFEEYVLSNLRTFGAKPLLGVAIQCGAVRLQSACVTEMLLGIVDRIQYSGDYNLCEEIQDLLAYHLDEIVKEKLHKAIGFLLVGALDIAWKNYYGVAVNHTEIRDIMRL